jgi:hypothetical protein
MGSGGAGGPPGGPGGADWPRSSRFAGIAVGRPLVTHWVAAHLRLDRLRCACSLRHYDPAASPDWHHPRGVNAEIGDELFVSRHVVKSPPAQRLPPAEPGLMPGRVSASSYRAILQTEAPLEREASPAARPAVHAGLVHANQTRSVLSSSAELPPSRSISMSVNLALRAFCMAASGNDPSLTV